MGYAKTLTYGYSSVAGPAGSIPTLTTVDTNFDCGTLVTPAYTDPLKEAYVEVHIKGRADTSGFNNWIDSTPTAYIGLNPSTTFNCGTIASPELFTPASTFVGADYILYGRTNVASHLSPSTSYTCQLMHTTVQNNNLLLYGVQFILKLYFEG
jgi:hypothetical protein